MTTHSSIALIAFLLLLVAFGLVVGCSQVDHTGLDASAIGVASGKRVTAQNDGGVLIYYLDQMGQDPDNSQARQEYEAHLDLCRQAQQHIVPLSADDVAKLGVRRVREWQKPGRAVRQIDTWQPVLAGNSISDACNFGGVIEQSARTIWAPPSGLYYLDLTKGTGTYEVIPNYSLRRSPVPDTSETGVGKLIKVGQSKAVGQPCDIWKVIFSTGNGFIECNWSGGKKWGYSSLGEIVLWRKAIGDPTFTPNAEWVRTREFDVGHLPDGSDKFFEIPENVSIRSKTPGVAVPEGKP